MGREERHQELFQTVGFQDGVGYGFCFSKHLLEFTSASCPQALPGAPLFLSPPCILTACFAQDAFLFRAGPSSGQRLRWLRPYRQVPSAAADTDRR